MELHQFFLFLVRYSSRSGKVGAWHIREALLWQPGACARKGIIAGLIAP